MDLFVYGCRPLFNNIETQTAWNEPWTLSITKSHKTHQVACTSSCLRPFFFGTLNIGDSRLQRPVLAFRDVSRIALESISECSPRLCFSHRECRSRHIQRLEKVFCNVRFIGLGEEDLWKVRKRFIHQVIIL